MKTNAILFCALIRIGAICCAGETHVVKLIVDSPPTFDDGATAPRYVVGIAADPPLSSRGRELVMSDANGTRYTCYLPPEIETGEEQGSTPALLAEDAIQATKTPDELLDALNDLCLYRNEGWWVYEVCYKKNARQYHQGDDGVTAEYSLGNFSSTAADPNEVLADESEVSAAAKYVRHAHTGGEACELTGEGRSVEVRYACSTSAGQTLLAEVREPRSCAYVFTVATPLLCKHPGFRARPPPVVPIGCVPMGGVGGKLSGGSSDDGADAQEGVCAAEGSCAAPGLQAAAALAAQELEGEVLGEHGAPDANKSSSIDGAMPEGAGEDVDGVALDDLLGGYHDDYPE